MNCPCDQFDFPPKLEIPAGLDALPRQIATFPEFRQAMLTATSSKPALAQWRARSSDDFGIMLLEMWAYVCDCISFYDEGIADEAYIGTASLRPSVRKLINLLGYVPRPAIGASVDLAIIASGRLPVTIPAGTQFLSGAFPGGPPKVFELATDARVHPYLNKWTLERRRRTTLTAGPPYPASQQSLLVDARTNRLQAEQIVLVADLENESRTRVRIVQGVTDTTGRDGAKYQTLVLDSPVGIPGSTPLESVRLLTPAQTGTIWQNPYASSSTGLIGSASSRAVIVFDTTHRDIQVNDRVVLDKAGDMRWFRVVRMADVQAALPSTGSATVKDPSGNVTGTVAVASQITLTAIALDAGINDPSRREAGPPDWVPADAAAVKVRFGLRTAANLASEMSLTLNPGDPTILAPPVEPPQNGKEPGLFLLEGSDTLGTEITGSIDFNSRVLTPAPPLSVALAAPVEVYGNVVTATEGQSVKAEVLGSGDASQASQSFKLKKRPLSYSAGIEAPIAALRVYVDGLLWSETPSFFGVAPDAQVYLVRQDDAGDSWITFGDGVRGSRLTTGGDNVVAYYRYGAGKASPPAGSIQQLGQAVKGVSSVRNPVAAGGGDDAEPAAQMQTYAPRSALLLGRAISLDDMTAAAAAVGGVRAVRCEWRWNLKRQRPLVEVWYIGAPSIKKYIRQKLLGLSDSVTPIEVDTANPVLSTLSLSVEVDPRRVEDDVLAALRAGLMNPDSGLLAPERAGIGVALFESRIFAAVLAVPGAVAVHGLLLNGAPLTGYGVTPGAGNYFDFENGAVVLNGRAA